MPRRRRRVSIWAAHMPFETLDIMLIVLIPVLIAVLLSLLVLALVVVPARREGRIVLTPRGEEVAQKVKAGTDAAAARTGEVVASAAARIRSSDTKATGETKA